MRIAARFLPGVIVTERIEARVDIQWEQRMVLSSSRIASAVAHACIGAVTS